MTFPSRWQFCRAGITNVYQYENEVFSFRDGRLLLRGINGSGKSTAMNMLLPFLLTGKTRGIDAAGEQTGVLKSWMLSGRDEKQPVGYLWLEFARQQNSEAEVDYVTIGCGIKANRASDTVNTWWFVTDRRPGIDFELLEQQIPLSVDALRHVIQPDVVYPQDRRGDYRQEVGRRLYGGASVDSFLDLINTVRSPRVGDRVDVELPQYLVAALPNLSETALIEAARPLDDLDEHRRNVGELSTTSDALAAIVEVYRNYAVTELQRELAKSQETLSDLRRKRRALKKSLQEWTDSQQAETQARESLATLEAKVEHLSQQVQTLERSPAYTEGQQLEDLRRHVVSLQAMLAKDTKNLETHRERQPRVTADVLQAEQRTDALWQKLADEITQTTRAAEQVALEARPPGIVAVPRLPLSEQPSTEQSLTEPLETFDADGVNSKLTVLAVDSQARKADLDTVREQLRRVDTATAAHQSARLAQTDALESVQENSERFDASRQTLRKAREDWIESATAWVQAARTAIVNASRPPGFERIEATYLNTEALKSSADLAAIRRVLEQGINDTRDAQQRVTIALESRVKDYRAACDQAQTELDELNAMTEPQVPRWDWQLSDTECFADLIDFRDDLSATQRALLEAALQASGLLTATIKAEGIALQNGELIISSQAPVEQPLSQLLQITLPAQSGIDRQLVQKTLEGISTEWSTNAASVVTTDGRFRLGSLSGRHIKSSAEYVGISARRARLEFLRREAAATLEQARTALQQSEADYTAAAGYTDELDKFRKDLPTLDHVDSAIAKAAAHEDELQRARERLAIREQTVIAAEKSLSVADVECHRVCRNLQLPAEYRGLDAIERSLSELISGVATAQGLSNSVKQACRDWTAAADRWRLARDDLRQAIERRAASKQEYDGKQTRLDTLEATLGTSYAEVVAQINECQLQSNNAKSAIPEARQLAEESIRLTQIAFNDKENNSAAERAAEQRCTADYEHLYTVTQVPGLLAAVVINNETADQENKTIELPASNADAEGLETLANVLQQCLVDDRAAATSADGVRTSLRQRRATLGAGWDAEDNQPDTNLPISVSVNGPLGQMPLAESLHAVQTQLLRLQALLTEKQDQALRNLLQGLIAREVAEKMFQARRLIDRMNKRLGSVTSTHGIGVRLRWRQSPELDDSVAATVKILGKQPDLRTEDEEAILRDALASALEEARRLEPDAPYRQLIAQVFEYRAWHDMAVLLRRGDEVEKRLSRRTPLSEGEKKLVSYLPLFAAVAASCDALTDAGDETIPRFLLLDDAFAKVSEDNHAALFGLLVDLDLDFIATSERLWGTHASVPGLAITEVVRDTSLGAILLEHSHWDGNTLHLAAPPDLEEEAFGSGLMAAEQPDASGEPQHVN